jgi:hypothetical protein
MDNKKLIRLVLAGSMVASFIAMVRNRNIILGLLPKPFKGAVKASPTYHIYKASVNRLEIAILHAKGELFRLPPAPEEVALILSEWNQNGRPLPGPGVFKVDVLDLYRQKFGLTTLIETGTFSGDTPAALKDVFSRIYSIELNPELVRRVRERFRDDTHITILHGDSEECLPEILAELHEPGLFWLDSHYSGGVTSLGHKVTPILGELESILAHSVQGHILLIDDARDFRHDKGHPTLNELEAFIAVRRPRLRFEVEDDIIRVTPG